MTPEARAELEHAVAAIEAADTLIAARADGMRRFLKECDDMEATSPSLFAASEHRAVRALLGPMFRSALSFHAAFDAQRKAASSALARVTSHA